MAHPTKLTDHVIKRMEGRAQSIRAQTKQREEVEGAEEVGFTSPVEGRPVVDAHAFVADLADCGRSSVEKWVTRGRNELARELRGRKLSKDARLYARFADAFDTLRTSSAQRISDPLVDTAIQTADKPAQIAAAKLVLPRIDPQHWGVQGLKVEISAAPQASVSIEKLPQEVIDAMTAEQLEAIEQHEQTIDEAQAAIDEIIASLG